MLKRWIPVLLPLLWTALIWGNSLQPAEVSGELSGGVVALVEPVLTAVGIPAEHHSFVVRKSAHFAEFAGLAVLWLVVFLKRPVVSGAMLTLLLCAATAALDEGIQHFVPGRSCALRDWGIDTLGAAVGAGVFVLTAQIQKKRGSRREKTEA